MTNIQTGKIKKGNPHSCNGNKPMPAVAVEQLTQLNLIMEEFENGKKN